MGKMSIDQLTRCAFVWAEGDRRSFAQCYPKGSKERKKAISQANQLHEYRTKTWGKTALESAVEKASFVEIKTLKD